MKMIIVTRKNDGAKIYINPVNICAVYPRLKDTDRTIVSLIDGGYVETKESVDTVAHMIEKIDLVRWPSGGI